MGTAGAMVADVGDDATAEFAALGAAASTDRLEAPTPTSISTLHASLFDVEPFADSLAPVVGQVLASGRPHGVVSWVRERVALLRHPESGSYLPETWEADLHAALDSCAQEGAAAAEANHDQETAAFTGLALTMYYEPEIVKSIGRGAVTLAMLADVTGTRQLILGTTIAVGDRQLTDGSGRIVRILAPADIADAVDALDRLRDDVLSGTGSATRAGQARPPLSRADAQALRQSFERLGGMLQEANEDGVGLILFASH